jgi:hypothetical protein
MPEHGYVKADFDGALASYRKRFGAEPPGVGCSLARYWTILDGLESGCAVDKAKLDAHETTVAKITDRYARVLVDVPTVSPPLRRAHLVTRPAVSRFGMVP